MTPEERANAAYEDWKNGATVGHPALSYRIDGLPQVIAALGSKLNEFAT